MYDFYRAVRFLIQHHGLVAILDALAEQFPEYRREFEELAESVKREALLLHRK